MSHRAVALLLFFCPLFCGAFVLSRHPAAVNVPVIRLTPQVHDFGILLPFSTATHAFTAVNPLSQTLLIDRIIRSCGCTTAAADRLTVAPGEKFSVTTILSAHAAGEGVVSHVDLLAHAGQQRVELNLKLLADVENAIDFPQDAGYIRLGSYLLNELPATATIQVQRGRYPLDFDAVQIDCPGPQLAADVHATPGGIWNVTFRINSADALGANGYPVTFHLLNHGKRLDADVQKQAYVEMRGPVLAEPSSLLLTVAPREHVRKSIEIASRSGGAAPQITAAFSNCKNAVVAVRTNGGRTWIDLDYTAVPQTAEDRGEITVSASQNGRIYKLKIGFLVIASG
jgi:hypothetical protein